MIDAAGELIYVGKAKSLRARLLGYFRPKSRDEKAGKIIKETRRLVWELAGSEFAALLRELELIRRWQPRFNVQGQPRRHRRCYVCIGRRPAAYAFVAATPPSTAAASFGPVPGPRKARESARRLNDWFRLRDCPQKQTMVFADQGELFPLVRAPGCIRHDIGQCLAPLRRRLHPGRLRLSCGRGRGFPQRQGSLAGGAAHARDERGLGGAAVRARLCAAG